MSKTVLNVKTDQEVKEAAQKIAAELGLPLSVIVNAQLKDFIRDRAVNFSAVPRMSRGLEQLLGRVETDIAQKRNLSPVFSSTKEALEYLDGR